MKYTCLLLTLILWFTGCNNNASNNKDALLKAIKEWQGKEIVFPNSVKFLKFGTDTTACFDSIPNTQHKVLIYTDSLGCISCKLHLREWQKFINHIDSLQSDVSFLFFFNTNNFEEVNYLLRRDKLRHPVCFDVNDSLNKLNNFPKHNDFQTFLLDTDNRVVVVGNPVNNPKVKELYLRVIEGKQPNTTSNDTPQTEANVASPVINVGSFLLIDGKKAMFIIENTGNNPLIITDVISSCGCTSVDYAKTPAESGHKTEIFVDIKPEAKGIFEETLKVYCNTPQSPITLRVKGIAN